ncbi:MAG: transporter [Candidatus Methylomirabilales bacterium]
MGKCFAAPLSVVITISLVVVAPVVARAAPIFGQSPRTQFFLGTAVRSFGSFQKFSGGGKELEVWSAPVIGSYAVAPDVTLNLVVPYLSKRFKTPTETLEASGVGDTTVFAKYRIYRRDVPFGRDQLSLIGGLDLPSGSDTEGPGLVNAPPLQLGSGSVDGLLGVAVGTTRRSYSIEAALRSKLNSEANDFRFGNALLYDLYLAYQTYPGWPMPPAQLNFSLELNGQTAANNEVNGVEVGPSGGTVLFLSPGIQYILTGNLLFEAGVQIPVVRNFDPSQLEPDYTVLFGFRYLF